MKFSFNKQYHSMSEIIKNIIFHLLLNFYLNIFTIKILWEYKISNIMYLVFVLCSINFFSLNISIYQINLNLLIDLTLFFKIVHHYHMQHQWVIINVTFPHNQDNSKYIMMIYIRQTSVQLKLFL